MAGRSVKRLQNTINRCDAEWPVFPGIEHSVDPNGCASALPCCSRPSPALPRKRALTIAAIQKINAAWKLPAEALVQPYHLEDGTSRRA